MPIRDIRLLKTELRQKYKRIRKNLDPEKQRAMDAEIQTRLLALRQYGESDVIFTYLSKPIEVDTFGLVRAAWANRKRVAVPKCIPETTQMEFYYITSMDDLTPGAFGVLEPVPERCRLVTDYSRGLCVVPGLCFDAEGYRLGYGKGYYDRFLSAFRGVTVGICYTACTQWRLPHGRYDRQIQLLITEKYIRRTYTRGAENGGSHER